MKPKTIIFFHNGFAAVCDENGQQMPQYQKGNHMQVIEKLKQDGYNWEALDYSGSPRKYCAHCGREFPEWPQ